MERFRAILLRVWQETCRHIDIHESTISIASLLADEMPLDALLVRGLDAKRGRLETIAVGPAGRASLEASPVQCSPSESARLLAWCRRGEIGHRGASPASRGSWLAWVPSGAAAEALVGPLASARGALGALVLLARPRCQFDGTHAAMVRGLLEPFGVALENHHQLHELRTLRAAAEAEKQSLLTKLGRDHIEDTVVGADAGLRGVMDRVQLVARSDVPVLIFGETGAGKEVIARAIHAGSPRAAGPFIRVNCGAIPPDLIDAQLFGHQRGSFTGAFDTRKGWFERADGGTLFLDEIGELPLAAQVRLLRVLQDGYLERVGGDEPIKVDTRIVAATHRDLTAMVREGRFREDLWYRIAVFPVLLPPLRDHPEDIPSLARHFAQRAALRFGLPLQMPAPEDLAVLGAYPWPGNVRELATVIDRAAILGNGRRLEVVKALGTGGLSPAPEPASAGTPPAATSARPTLEPLDTAMRRHIERALGATRGRIEGPGGAAALLRINPHTLRARMRKLGITWGRFRAASAE